MIKQAFKRHTLCSLVNATTFPLATSFEILELTTTERHLEKKNVQGRTAESQETIFKTLLKAGIIIHT